MKATNLSKPMTKLKNLIMLIRLHRRFSEKQVPILIEQRIPVYDPYKKRSRN
jgi:hypothetical protein